MISPTSPLGYLLTVLDLHLNRARSERGASAVEWVIISAIVVGICIAIAATLSGALEGEANDIGNKIKSQ